MEFSQIKRKLEKYNNNLKVLHFNCRILARKRSDLKQLIKIFNDNTIFGFSEWWFNDANDDKLWAIDNDKHKLFRCDRTYESSKKKLKGGGVILLVPKKLNPKVRHDLNNMHKKYDSIWIKFKAGLNKKDRITLLNLAYNPNRNNKTDFLKDLAKSIDHAQSFNSKLILLGDYNLNYLNEDDKQFSDTIIIPYNLDVTNELTPTNSKALIDYIINDLSIKDLKNNSIVFTPPIKSDNQATAFITELKLNNNVRPIKRKIYDKSKYSDYNSNKNYQLYIGEVSIAIIIPKKC